ncbi:hypothetical protein BDP27DRAFT_623163 [Rhodocollybia butyracea]|uniref:Uncharacterized protein n=1 Tax=Rhodocollybia butyracea TaxID=206335 RepID=A0A9P5U9U2_9AGAR|nr:hypothetical protein BDP27DRAFT_623163 [Rhodocollybia butyracea]
MTFIKNVHEIPDALNLDLFKAALSKSLSIYRHACGHLCQEAPEVEGMSLWKIRITDSPVPVEIVEKDTPILTDCVIQDDLTSFLPHPNSEVVNNDSPLLSFKLHISKQRTFIGVAWHHTLGDAATLLRFMNTLSRYYQGHDIDHGSLPSFKKHRFPTPSVDDFPRWLPYMSHLAHTYSSTEIQDKYAEGNEVIIPIRAIIRRSEAEILRGRVRRMLGPDSKLEISIQDCLTACFVVATNNLQTNTVLGVRRITNAAGFRQIVTEWNEPNVAGNSIYIVPSADFDPNRVQDIAYISATIRKSLMEARKPDFLASYMSVAGYQMALAAERKETFFFGSDLTTISVNSNAILNWQGADFGYPSARFFTPGITRFYMRVFPANNYRESEALDLTFGAPASMRQAILEKLGPEFSIM